MSTILDKAHADYQASQEKQAADAKRINEEAVTKLLSDARKLAVTVFGADPDEVTVGRDDQEALVFYHSEPIALLYHPHHFGSSGYRKPARFYLVREFCAVCGNPLLAGHDGYSPDITTWSDFCRVLCGEGTNLLGHSEDCSRRPELVLMAPVPAPQPTIGQQLEDLIRSIAEGAVEDHACGCSARQS